jgi:hypothetical protein
MTDKFQEALGDMPNCVFGNYDALTHKTVADLVYCAQHELDLYNEGEFCDIRSPVGAKQAKKFIEKWSGK